MTEQDIRDINWPAVFMGFGVDWVFSDLVGLIVTVIMLTLKGISLDADIVMPADVVLVGRFVGVLGAVVGGTVAGYVARRRGSLHGVLGSVVGLVVSFVLFGLLRDVGDLGFILLNLIGAGYGGGLGERWRARRESDS